LINAVAAANPNTVVVLDTANPVLMPWLPNVKSVLEMWFAGQEGGTSTSRVLLGLANPSGHSSLTWAANPTDTIWGYNETTPLYSGDTTGTHPERLNGNGGCTVIAGSGATCPTATGTVESEGIFNGYRFFDKEGITPAIPFGFGLSYTRFRYSGLSVTPTAGAADVSFDVTNTGSVAGADAAQVYLGAGPDVAGVQQAVRSLHGFERVDLASGQTKHVTIHLDKRSFEYWNEKTQQWVTNWGTRQLWVGDADALANLPLSTSVAPLKSLVAEASDLLAMVQGVGPGNSLTAKATVLQAAAAKGQTARICSSLTAFENEVRAQAGKTLPTDLAAQLQEQASRIGLAAGC
jgi:beta-glucosidase